MKSPLTHTHIRTHTRKQEYFQVCFFITSLFLSSFIVTYFHFSRFFRWEKNKQTIEPKSFRRWRLNTHFHHAVVLGIVKLTARFKIITLGNRGKFNQVNMNSVPSETHTSSGGVWPLRGCCGERVCFTQMPSKWCFLWVWAAFLTFSGTFPAPPAASASRLPLAGPSSWFHLCWQVTGDMSHQVTTSVPAVSYHTAGFFGGGGASLLGGSWNV